MTISASSTFNVADQTPITVAASVVVQPPVGYGTGGRGRLVHPTLGTYDYASTPDEVEGVDGDVIYPPVWAHAATLGGAVDALWSGFRRDAKIIERWAQGDVGCPIAHLRQLCQFWMNAPDPSTAAVQWSPNYLNGHTYSVAIVDLRSGGAQGYKLDVRLARSIAEGGLGGFAPKPVELELRILGMVS